MLPSTSALSLCGEPDDGLRDAIDLSGLGRTRLAGRGPLTRSMPEPPRPGTSPSDRHTVLQCCGRRLPKDPPLLVWQSPALRAEPALMAVSSGTAEAGARGLHPVHVRISPILHGVIMSNFCRHRLDAVVRFCARNRPFHLVVITPLSLTSCVRASPWLIH